MTSNVQKRTKTQIAGLFLGPVLFFLVLLLFDFVPAKPVVTRMAAVSLLMAVWQNTVCTLVLQVIDGKFEVIWPLDVATARFVP